jgi:hypothetical protein
MVKMKLSRMFTLVLGLTAALSQGCGSDSNGNSNGSGSGGSGNASGMTSCDYTKCTGDPSYGLFSQEACDALMKAPVPPNTPPRTSARSPRHVQQQRQ